MCGDPWRLLRVPLLGGDARDRLLHLRGRPLLGALPFTDRQVVR